MCQWQSRKEALRIVFEGTCSSLHLFLQSTILPKHLTQKLTDKVSPPYQAGGWRERRCPFSDTCKELTTPGKLLKCQSRYDKYWNKFFLKREREKKILPSGRCEGEISISSIFKIRRNSSRLVNYLISGKAIDFCLESPWEPPQPGFSPLARISGLRGTDHSK